MTKHLSESITVTQETTEAHIPVQRMGGVALGEISTDEKEARRLAYLKSNRTQDHGTAPQQLGIAPKEDYLGGTPKAKLERKVARKDMDEQLASLSGLELSQRANALLKEYEDDPTLEYPFTSDSMDDVTESEDDMPSIIANPSTIITQGWELSRVFKEAERTNPADPYETTPKEEDRGEYVKDGFIIRDGRPGQ